MGMMRRTLLAAALLSLSILACGHGRVGGPIPVSPVDAKTAGGDHNAFAATLHAAVAGKSGNMVYSPTSVAMALAMARGGARGNTAPGMGKGLSPGATRGTKELVWRVEGTLGSPAQN